MLVPINGNQEIRYFSDEEINEAREKVPSFTSEKYIADNDAVRMCVEWLDGQKLTRASNSVACEDYVSLWAYKTIRRVDMEIAAYMHPRIYGIYPYYNVSKRRIKPSRVRLEGIRSAYKDKEQVINDPDICDIKYVSDEPYYPAISFM